MFPSNITLYSEKSSFIRLNKKKVTHQSLYITLYRIIWVCSKVVDCLLYNRVVAGSRPHKDQYDFEDKKPDSVTIGNRALVVYVL